MRLKHRTFLLPILAVLVPCGTALALPRPFAPFSQAAAVRDENKELLDRRLFHAISSGDHSRVSAALKAGAAVDAKTTSGQTPLHFAVYSGHAEVVTPLLTAGSCDNFEPLHRAAFLGRIEVMTKLLEAEAEIDATDTAGWTPLHAAAGMGHGEVVTILLKSGAAVDATDTNGCTPLHAAAGMGRSEVVTILLKAGAAVDAKTTLGETPLHAAATAGSAEVVTLLLKVGADPRATNKDGKTPHVLAKDEECRDLLWNAMMEKPLK